jgi:hypothetical protein
LNCAVSFLFLLTTSSCGSCVAFNDDTAGGSCVACAVG